MLANISPEEWSIDTWVNITKWVIASCVVIVTSVIGWAIALRKKINRKADQEEVEAMFKKYDEDNEGIKEDITELKIQMAVQSSTVKGIALNVSKLVDNLINKK